MNVGQILEARGKAYEYLFGPNCSVQTEVGATGHPIDICVYAPFVDEDGSARDFFTFITWGMSNRRMPNPSASEPYRTELVIYCNEPRDIYCRLLRWLANLPSEQKGTWYDFGTTMTHGQPPQPIFPGSELSAFLFLDPPIVGDHSLGEMLTVEGDPVILLWVIPITETERQYVVERGITAFLSVLDQVRHPIFLAETRRSYVKF